MAKKDLVRLLIQLFGDPQLHERIRKDPEAALGKLGLTKKEIELFQSKDEKAIRDYVGREAGKMTIVTNWMPGDKKTKK
jgi:hypothetical protein